MLGLNVPLLGSHYQLCVETLLTLEQIVWQPTDYEQTAHTTVQLSVCQLLYGADCTWTANM